jgi:hypothetical protein
MAEGIVYLDVDDEITSAAQRIRSAPGTKVALVVPYGSRIATSRMNFRLLSREAVVSNRRLSIVSGDAAARSLAASAGLPVFGSVAEYEASIARPADARGGGERGPGPAGVDPPIAGDLVASETVVAAGLPGASDETATAVPTAAAHPPSADPVPAPARGRKSQTPKRPPPDSSTLALAGDLASEPDDWMDEEPGVRSGGRNRAPLFAALGLAGLAVPPRQRRRYQQLPER